MSADARALRVSLVSGSHLTAHDRAGVRFAVASGVHCARSPRVAWTVLPTAGTDGATHAVTCETTGRDDFGRPVTRRHRSRVRVSA